MIVITRYIAKHELKPLRRYFELEDIIEGARKIQKNLGIQIHVQSTSSAFQFFKVQIGQKVKGRMIVFMRTGNEKIVPILIRLKKDKIFGMNMSANNTDVAKQISKNLDHILEDIENNNYEEFPY